MSQAAVATPATTSNSATTSSAGPTSGSPGQKSDQNSGAPAKYTGQEPKATAAGKPGQEEWDTLKIGDKEHRVPKGLGEHIKRLEKESQDRFQKAAEERRIVDQKEAKIQQLSQLAEKSPKEFIKRFGIDPDEFAEATMTEKFKMMQMTPEQKELAEIKAWKAQRDKEDQERQEKDKQEQMSKQEAQLYEQTSKSLIEAWKDSNLPWEPWYGMRIMATKMAADSQKLDWTLKQCADKVKSEFEGVVRKVASQLPPEQFQALLGEDALKKWREYDLKRVTDKTAPKIHSAESRRSPGESPASTKDKKDSKRSMNEKEFLQFFDA